MAHDACPVNLQTYFQEDLPKEAGTFSPFGLARGVSGGLALERSPDPHVCPRLAASWEALAHVVSISNLPLNTQTPHSQPYLIATAARPPAQWLVELTYHSRRLG
jgi:hypothetical protein